MRAFKNLLQSTKHKALLLFFLLSGIAVSAQNSIGETLSMLPTSVDNNQVQQLLSDGPEDFERHRIWLNLMHDQNYVNQILIGYMTWATQEVDPGMDALSMSTGTAISSLIGTNGYVIQGRALPFTCDDIVPLEFKSTIDGEFTINIDYVDGLFAGDQGIFLRDNVTNIVTDLKAGSYTFSTLPGTYQSRFELIYQNAALGIQEPKFNSQVTVYKENGAIAINSGMTMMKDIKIYDLNGRLVYSKNNINNTSTKCNDFSTERQVLLVQIVSDENSIATKKIAY